MKKPVWSLGVVELSEAYKGREVSPHDVFASLAARIDNINRIVHAFTTQTLERAEREADECTEQLARGVTRGPLHGIPVGVKELFDVEGARTTYGSTIFSDRIATEDAEVVRRLRAAGAIVMGLTRSHELGWGITTQHAKLGGTRNPWSLDRVPGGSSGGSAAAVAAGLIPLALGSDTGGSIRIPSGFCGVTGLKPSFGRISKRGAVALAPSLDHPGPIAREVRDLVLAFSVMAGYDPDDPTTFDQPVPTCDELESGLKGLRIGVVPDLHLTPLRADHQKVFEKVVGIVTSSGAELREARFPNAEEIRPSYQTIQMAEAYYVHSKVLQTFPQRSDEYGSDVRSRLASATQVDLSQYIAARDMAARIRRRFELLFQEVDATLTPVTAGGPSFIKDPDVVQHFGQQIPFRDLVMDYTVPQDVAGLPSCSIRAGFDADGVPVGVQVTAPFGREDVALRVARFLESALHDPQSAWPPVALTGQSP